MMRTNGELREEVLGVGAAILAHDRAHLALDRVKGFADPPLNRRLEEVIALARIAARHGARAANLGAFRLGDGARDLDPELERATVIVAGDLEREMRDVG